MLERLNNLFIKVFLIIFIMGAINSAYSEENKAEFIKNNWSFEGVFGNSALFS